MINLHTAKGFEALLAEGVEHSPYEYGMLFEAKGFWARRRAKARWKLLQKIDAKLRRVLHPDERVYFLSTGTLSDFGAQFFEGHAAAYYVNLRALIFTTERIVLMQIGRGQKPTLLVSELPYASLREVKSTWTGFCQLTLVNGKKHKLSRMPSADRKYLHGFLNGIVMQAAGGTAGGDAAAALGLRKGADGLRHLCPHCFVPLAGKPSVCPSCGGSIRSANTAAWLSLLFPGLGDWYLGYRWLAAMEMIGVGFLWLIMVVLPALGISTEESGAHGIDVVEPMEKAELGPEYWVIAAVVILVAHAIDAVMTRSYGLKGHHPGKPVAS